MYEPTPSREELANWGMTEADLAAVNVYPDVERACDLFSFMRTQWRVGMGGAVGLEYAVAFHKMDRMRLSPDEYEQLELDMRVMEGEALDVMRERAQKK